MMQQMSILVKLILYQLIDLQSILKLLILRNILFFQPDEGVIFIREGFLDREVQVMFSELDVEIPKEEISKSNKQLKSCN